MRILALLVLAALVARRARDRRVLRRERLSEQVGGHRQEAEAHYSRVRELAERQALREDAAEQSAEQLRLQSPRAPLPRKYRACAEDFEAKTSEVDENVARAGDRPHGVIRRKPANSSEKL